LETKGIRHEIRVGTSACDSPTNRPPAGEPSRQFHDGQAVNRVPFAPNLRERRWLNIRSPACGCDELVVEGERDCRQTMDCRYGEWRQESPSMMSPIRRYFARRRTQAAFGGNLSPAMVERMVQSGEEPILRGAAVEITAFFANVQGYVGIAEQVPLPRLLGLMNAWFEAGTTAVQNDLTVRNGS
jgi:hypothetical protein